MIEYEYPLNERFRCYLKIEQLLKQAEACVSIETQAHVVTLFKALFELLELVERSDLKADLLKDIEQLQQKLVQWSHVPNVDLSQLKGLHDQLGQSSKTLLDTPRVGQKLKSHRLFTNVRQRFHLAGGLACFDLPNLHYWLYHPLAKSTRQKDIQFWLQEINILGQPLKMILGLIRESSIFSTIEVNHGFLQHQLTQEADLLRVRLPSSLQAYPLFSGHKNRFTLRLIPAEEGLTLPEHLTLDLATC